MSNGVRLLAIGLVAGLLAGCQTLGLTPASSRPETVIEGDVCRRAEIARSEYFEREVERLRADLRQAEESIVAMESGLRGFQSRADAVSAVAEAHIALDRVERKVPWRADQVAEARSKLAEANRQLDLGHVGSAVFFASRAKRITESLLDESHQVEQWPDRRLIEGGDLVNLRAGPSLDYRVLDRLASGTPVFPERSDGDWRLVRTPTGQVGWVHRSLLRTP